MSPQEALTPVQQDALKELINIGFGKAAAALSILLAERIRLGTPELGLIPPDQLPLIIQKTRAGAQPGYLVEQRFSGGFSGRGLLHFPLSHIAAAVTERSSALSLEDEQYTPQLVEHDTAAEAGNMVIEACVGTLSEALDCRLAFQPPQVLEPGAALTQCGNGNGQPQPAEILCHIRFELEESGAPGDLFIALKGTSLSWLQAALDNFLAAQS